MIRKLLLTLLISALLGATARAEDCKKSAFFEQQELQWNDAHRSGDLIALKQVWADDIAIFIPGMPPLSKEDAVKMWQAVPVRFEEYRSEVLTVRCTGKFAIVNGAIDRVRDFAGRQAEESWYFTKLYQKRGGAWRVVVFHASEREK